MSDLAAVIRRATARLKRASLARKYDPNQPRVPAGNSDGGQWTDGGGRGGAASPRSSPRRPSNRERDSSAPGGWALRAREKIEGGERTLHAGPGGALIASESRTGPFTGARTSSHSVRMPDGSGLRIENDRTGVQRIFDERGNLLAATRWGRKGPEDVVAAQLAFFDDRPPRLPKGALWLDLGLTIYDALKDRVENSRPVVTAFIRQYRAQGEGLLPVYVGEIDQREADRACRRYPEVRKQLTEFFVNELPLFPDNPSALGTRVHWKMDEYVRGLGDPDFQSEVTDKNGQPAKRRNAGATFPDIYEKMSADTVCVYDHKTGSSRLWPGRAKQLADTAARLMGPLVRRIIVIEVRPAL